MAGGRRRSEQCMRGALYSPGDVPPLKCFQTSVESVSQGDGRMKRSRFSDEQIIGILKEQEAGAVTADVCRRHGISGTHPRSLSITHISDVAFALIESFVILFVTPIRGGVTDEWGEGSQYIRLA